MKQKSLSFTSPLQPDRMCQRCTLYQHANSVCLMGSGSSRSGVMVVGEAPGEREDALDRPFSGRSGNLLDRLLREAGISRDDVYVTNTVKCRPPENRKPDKKEIKACSFHLDREIEHLKPKYVLLLGATALGVVGKSKITELHGRPIEKDGVVYFPVFHPAYVLRDPSKEPIFADDIRKFADLVNGKRTLSYDAKWKVVNHRNLEDFVDHFNESDSFAFDLETTDVTWWDVYQRINLMVIAVPGMSYVVPMGLGDSPVRNNMEWQRDLVHLLVGLSAGKWCVAQNGKFDNLWLMSRFGTRFHLDFDTMLAHHILNENLPHDLKFLVKTVLNGPDYDLPLREKQGHVPSAWPKLREYAGRDGGFTLELATRFREEIRKEPLLERMFYNLVMPAARLFERVESVGQYVNLERRSALREKLRDERKQSLRKLRSMAGKLINWNSPQQVGKLFFEDLGIPVTHLTGKGQPSTSESAILEIKDKYPIAGELTHYRELEKTLSTYVDGWDPLMVGPYAHFSYKLHGTVTGRYASRLHSIPRDDSIRSLIEAPEGWTYVAADYSQIELRIAAQVSGDVELQRLFQIGADVHSATASRILGVPPEKLTKEQRKMAKAVNFGFIYGMGFMKFVLYAWENYETRVTAKEGKKFRNAFFEMFNGLPKWHARQRRIVTTNGYVRTLTGRKRRLPAIYSPDEAARAEAGRLAINSPVQGFAAELKAMAMVEIGGTIPSEIVMVKGEHHDAILTWVKNEYLYEGMTQIKQIMERPKLLDTFGIELDVPIVAEVEYGPWGLGKKWDGSKPKQ